MRSYFFTNCTSTLKLPNKQQQDATKLDQHVSYYFFVNHMYPLISPIYDYILNRSLQYTE